MADSSEEIIFYNKGGRPKELTKKEAYEAKLLAKKKWRKSNKDRVALYNEMYRSGSKKKKSKKKSKHSKDRKGSIRSKISKSSLRKGSKKHSKNSVRKHSKKMSGGHHSKHTVTLLKVNPDGSRIVLIR